MTVLTLDRWGAGDARRLKSYQRDLLGHSSVSSMV